MKKGDIVCHKYFDELGTVVEVIDVDQIKVNIGRKNAVWQRINVRYYYLQSNYAVVVDGMVYQNPVDKKYPKLREGEIVING